jgi:large subunit ribosomal protein L3
MTTSTAQRDVTALLGTKLGMTQVWDDAGRVVPVTVVQVDTNVVTQVRTPEKDGYSAVQLAFGAVDPRRVTKPLKGHFEKAGVTPRLHLAEIRTANAESFNLGQEISAEVFQAGQTVDVTGTTKGKGTAGLMKRHGFRGVSASHGSHRNHRHAGSIGSSSTPSRVFKGLKMAGRMGHAQKTVLNLIVHSADTEKGLLLIKGAIPGPRGGTVLVRSAVKGA